MLTASTHPRSAASFRPIASGSAPRGGPLPAVAAAQALVAALPVVDPRAAAALPVVDRPLEQPQVSGATLALGPLVGDQPHAPQAGVHLAGAVGADPAAGPVPQLLGAAHGAGV